MGNPESDLLKPSVAKEHPIEDTSIDKKLEVQQSVNIRQWPIVEDDSVKQAVAQPTHASEQRECDSESSDAQQSVAFARVTPTLQRSPVDSAVGPSNHTKPINPLLINW